MNGKLLGFLGLSLVLALTLGTVPYAQRVEATAQASVAQAEMTEPYVTVARTRVNLRGGPGTNFPIVGSASNGERFSVVGKNQAGDWFEIARNGSANAWIYAPLVTLTGSAAEIPISADLAAAATGGTVADSAPAPTTDHGGLSGRLLYSVVNLDADRWELWEYSFASGSSAKIADWRTEVAVSLDNSQIAYFAWSGDVEDEGIYIMDSNLSNNRLLIPGDASYPSFNAGGDRLVFQGGRNIYVVNSDGNGLYQLTRGEYPAWSPVSNEIVHRACVRGACGLYVIDANSDNPNARRRLTTGGSDGQPAWSPDGRHIAYISQDDGNFEIYVINVDTSGKQRITQSPTSDGLPAWSPDGQWIAFRSDRGGSWAIYAMRPDGSDVRKIVDADVLPVWFFEKMAWRR